jgi:hypothetical protein
VPDDLHRAGGLRRAARRSPRSGSRSTSASPTACSSSATGSSDSSSLAVSRLTGCRLTATDAIAKAGALERHGIRTVDGRPSRRTRSTSPSSAAVRHRIRARAHGAAPRGTLVMKSTYAGDLTVNASSLSSTRSRSSARAAPVRAGAATRRRQDRSDGLIHARYRSATGLRRSSTRKGRGAEGADRVFDVKWGQRLLNSRE